MSNSAEALDTRAFRNALGNFPTGVTVMTAYSEQHGLAGVTANTDAAVGVIAAVGVFGGVPPPVFVGETNTFFPSLYFQ